ncbi:AcaC [Afipia sp. P52-10]|nr:AcaC [Afipia sp. P52-10]
MTAIGGDLIGGDPLALVGARCKACENFSFPPRAFCPACFSADKLERRPLRGEGTVFTFTVVRQAPAGHAVPYVLAFVDLHEGVRIMAQVRAEPEAVHIGMKVRAAFYIRTTDASSMAIYAFEPAPASMGAS